MERVLAAIFLMVLSYCTSPASRVAKKIKLCETIVQGLENIPKASVRLLKKSGGHFQDPEQSFSPNPG